jgi:hypothetical protein
MKRFEFPDELVTISPPQPQRWQWNCIASLAQRDQIICECRKKTPPPTPTPTPTPSGIYEQKLEIAIFGENELPTRKE